MGGTRTRGYARALVGWARFLEFTALGDTATNPPCHRKATPFACAGKRRSKSKHESKGREGVTVGDAPSAKTSMNDIEAKTS